MAPSQSWDIQSDSDLLDAVRAETQYDTGLISDDDLKDLRASAKRELALMADVTNFYDDRGITVALTGLVAVKAKGAVENSPVVTKNLSGEDVTFRTSDGSSLQVEQYEDMVQRGLANSSSTDAGVREIHLTNTWLSNSSSE
jgi:hypothetical protein